MENLDNNLDNLNIPKNVQLGNFRIDKVLIKRLKELSQGKRILSALIRTCILDYPSNADCPMITLHHRAVVSLNNVPIGKDVDDKITRLSIKWNVSKARAYNSIIKYMLDNSLIDLDNLK